MSLKVISSVNKKLVAAETKLGFQKEKIGTVHVLFSLREFPKSPTWPYPLHFVGQKVISPSHAPRNIVLGVGIIKIIILILKTENATNNLSQKLQAPISAYVKYNNNSTYNLQRSIKIMHLKYLAHFQLHKF